jgi:hypothetical protein
MAPFLLFEAGLATGDSVLFVLKSMLTIRI